MGESCPRLRVRSGRAELLYVAADAQRFASLLRECARGRYGTCVESDFPVLAARPAAIVPPLPASLRALFLLPVHTRLGPGEGLPVAPLREQVRQPQGHNTPAQRARCPVCRQSFLLHLHARSASELSERAL